MSELDAAIPTGASAKRPRPVISCLTCRRKKQKCSRTHPCQQCVKIGSPGRCEYQAGQEPEPNPEFASPYNVPTKRQRLLPPTGHVDREPFPHLLDAGDQVPAVAKQGVVEDLQERVARLEHAVLGQHRQLNSASLSSSCSPHLPRSTEQSEEVQPLDRTSQISSQFGEACMFMANLQHESNDERLLALRTDLGNLHYSVEVNHYRQGAQGMIAPVTAPHPLQLPPLHVCEKLAVLYFDNMEHCFRVLHLPQFKEQLHVLFTEGERACSFGFIPQLVGALTVAVLLGTHQECEAAAVSPMMKPSEAIRFMESFLRGLGHNQRYRLSALQVKMLVLICRWINTEPFDDILRLSGELLRDALVMRMDQDPTGLQSISVFEGELRRRCWMTIVEVDLMLSILCKMPCMIPSYSSKPPRNVNDEDIFEGMKTLPASRATTDWTDGLCQYLLAQTFPRRVAACSQLDKTSHVTAEDVLPHVRYLEKVLQELPPPLRFNYLGDEASKTPARLMARMELDISIRRPLMYLYLRGVTNLDPEASRRDLQAGFLQSCIMVTNYQDLFDPHYSELDVPRPQGYWDFFYNCYRQELGQATLGLCLEAKDMSPIVQGNGSISESSATSPNAPNNHAAKGPSYTKESLINAIKDTLEPMRRRLPYRGSKLKDVVLYEIILTSLLPEQTGQDKDAVTIQRLQHLIRECQDELARAGISVVGAPKLSSSKEASREIMSSNLTAFDPLWEGFPAVDILEPLDFNTSDGNPLGSGDPSLVLQLSLASQAELATLLEYVLADINLG